MGPGLLAAVALAAVIAALAWTVALQVIDPAVPIGPDGAAAGADEALTGLRDGAGIPEPSPDALAEVVERPVFSATRRPPSGQASATTGAAARPQSFELELTGVVVTGRQRLALVTQKGTAETVQLKEGDTYRGWTVDEIGAGFVVLRARGREQVVYLSYRPPAAASSDE
jgi:hypothetical protein